jgi:CheY-like chemotaxis protein
MSLARGPATGQDLFVGYAALEVAGAHRDRVRNRIEDGAVRSLRGLLLGADDYIVKPFEPDEFLAQARTLLRHARPTRR